MPYYDLRLQPRLRRGLRWALAAGAVAAVAAAWLARALAPYAGGGAVVAAGILAFLLVGAPLAGLALLHHHLRDASDQTQKLVSIRPLLGELSPPFGGWSIDPGFGELLAQTIVQLRPRLILECGAGTSTVIAAAMLRSLGSGRVVTLENEPEFAELTRQRIAEQGLSEWSHVITAPLTPHSLEGREWRWYRTDELADVAGEIDLLVVDGPHGALAPMVRYPAVPLLRGRLAPACTVLMDDGARPDECRIAARWAQQLGTRKRFFPGGKGAWLLGRPGH